MKMSELNIDDYNRYNFIKDTLFYFITTVLCKNEGDYYYFDKEIVPSTNVSIYSDLKDRIYSINDSNGETIFQHSQLFEFKDSYRSPEYKKSILITNKDKYITYEEAIKILSCININYHYFDDTILFIKSNWNHEINITDLFETVKSNNLSL